MARRDEDAITEISVIVYRMELGAEVADRMIAKDNDGGLKFRRRAAAKNTSTVRYMRALGLTVPMLAEPAPEPSEGLF